MNPTFAPIFRAEDGAVFGRASDASGSERYVLILPPRQEREQTQAAEETGQHEPAEYVQPAEVPNIYSLFTAAFGAHHEAEEGHAVSREHEIGPWVRPAYAILYAVAIVWVIRRCMRGASLERPTRAQLMVETVFGGLRDFFGDVVGKEHVHKFLAFLGSLFIYILVNNLMGLVPGFMPPTAWFQTTIALGICVFCYVNFQAIKEGGIGHYLWHLCGAPTNLVTWIFAPMIFLLELIGTFVKPLSLALRLFGNKFGEEKLMAAFLGLGMLIGAKLLHSPTPIVGIPLHLPFFFLGTLVSLIQAVVFALLAAVYIALLLPHHEHHEERAGETEKSLSETAAESPMHTSHV